MKAVDCMGFAGGFAAGVDQAGFDVIAKREPAKFKGFGVESHVYNMPWLADDVAVTAPEDWPLRLLDSLSQRLDPLYAAKLASSLADEVEPAVHGAREKALTRVGPGSDEVARARSALGAVIAGFTFSDA